MSRERSTWDPAAIAKRAAMPKTADPYLMNQDHVKQQPSADQYVTGTPSSFGEDVHPSGGTWEAEYSGGQVKRNEIGMPEMRNDTFNHPEKTAKEKATQKAGLCVAIARSMLRNASDQDVMKQAVAFMHLPDSEVMATFQRLAAQDEEQDADDQGQEQQKQAQDQGQEQKKDQQDQGKEAGQVPPQFLEHQKGKDEDKKDDKKEDKKDDEQTKQAALLRASQEQLAQMQQQMAQMQQQMAQMQQGQPQQTANQQQVQQQTAEQQQMSAQQQQIAQMVQQQMASGKSAVEAAAFAAQQCMGQQQRQTDDQLIDQMLADGGGIQAPTAELDIQIEAPEMDMADPMLGPEDEVLQSLFANDQSQQAQQEQQKQASVRTASSRTVGTRPTSGVSSIGGLPSAGGNGGKLNLENIWGSSPNVKEAFGLPTDR